MVVVAAVALANRVMVNKLKDDSDDHITHSHH